MISILFIKKKTAYEMRISDWSSDVCSSDLESRIGMVVAERRQHVFEEVQKRVDRYKSVPAGSGRVVVPVLIDRVAQFADEERPVLARPALMFGLVAVRERHKPGRRHRVREGQFVVAVQPGDVADRAGFGHPDRPVSTDS